MSALSINESLTEDHDRLDTGGDPEGAGQHDNRMILLRNPLCGSSVTFPNSWP